MPPRSARWQGKVRTSPSGVTSTGRPSELGRIDREARGGQALGQRAIDHPRSFLRLERAAGIDQHTTRREHVDGGAEQLALQPGEADNVGGSLVPGNVRVAADGAGRGAGRVEEDELDRSGRAPFAGVGDHDLGIELQAGEIGAQALGPPGRSSTATTRPPAAASCAVLPPGAAQRSMTARPAMAGSRRAGRAAAASCTHQAPSA